MGKWKGWMQMQMWRIAGWVGKWAAAALLVSALSVWTTGFIINSHVQNLVKQYNLPIEVQPIALSGVWKSFWGSSSGGSKEIGASASEGPIIATGDITGQGTDTSSGGAESEQGTGAWNGSVNENKGSTGSDGQPGEPNGAGSASGPGGVSSGANASEGEEQASGNLESDQASGASRENVEENSPPLSVEVGGGIGPKANSPIGSSGSEPGAGGGPSSEIWSEGSDPLVMSSDQLTSTKGQISTEDRQKMFALLIDKLPQEAWQKISAYMEDGLTESELQELQQVVAQHLNNEEYQALMKILKKY
ncbi:hypothetical protein ACFOQM_10225 [Paenibacillus sp. GCM10012307]|uniref:Spore coat protein n=1 Tax=Paenibacillus roseus TaxID=2798579 RepID=A0A934ML10_9BACL|nr:hypothetical protein [Paenibacillus roseus]MBJ6361660.1 hypothetical protein [Paenibacillus roseus]